MKNARNSERTVNSNSNSNSSSNKGRNEQEVDVLYQKMGDRWFAFSLVDDEVFVGSIGPDEIDAIRNKKSNSAKLSGNS